MSQANQRPTRAARVGRSAALKTLHSAGTLAALSTVLRSPKTAVLVSLLSDQLRALRDELTALQTEDRTAIARWEDDGGAQ